MLIFLFFCTLFTCSREEPIVPMSTEEPSMPATIDTLYYLALGDSYTIGESVAETERWPVQLANRLDGMTNPDIIARTGWTTDELQAGIASRNGLREKYDLVSLLIGVNNQFRGWPIDTYRTEFRELLDYAISKSMDGVDGVFVVSIPDYAFTPFGNGRPEISSGVDAFNAAAAEICQEVGVPFLNITLISRQGLELPELVAEDDLHPSGLQYQRWVNEVILPTAEDVLED